MIAFYVLNEYKSNIPWFCLTQHRISICDFSNKDNLRASTASLVFLDDAFISHRHSTQRTWIKCCYNYLIIAIASH